MIMRTSKLNTHILERQDNKLLYANNNAIEMFENTLIITNWLVNRCVLKTLIKQKAEITKTVSDYVDAYKCLDEKKELYFSLQNIHSQMFLMMI